MSSRLSFPELEGQLYRLGRLPEARPAIQSWRPLPRPPSRPRMDPVAVIERRVDLHYAMERHLTDDERSTLADYYGIGARGRSASILGIQRGSKSQVRPIVKKLRDLLAEE